ncbi:hypothetical protein [Pediococcus claussenii]|uniref:DUF5590 domain-containing protein n=1 Tax=Pediococcus claussenii (strain ATCC BAA-344 / DSM 14800 / JCM 18046 / KCTC 3811 / LMG 21948 / P06) TaxID=701521 RepID=G8PDF3_PEDCP|nr:hypothetical protein [Pediococcus claussenii]AEV95288.1 hypothetical protein PECL_1020 [Pediococcus claussenii ATCC BAA-344]
MERRNKKGKHPFLIILTIIVVSLVGIILLISNELVAPVRQTDKQVTSLVKKKVGLTSIGSVMRFTHGDPQYSVTGKRSGKDVLVVVSNKGKKLQVFNRAKGVSKQTAINTVIKKSKIDQITNTSFGYYKNQAVWVVSYISKANHLVVKTVAFDSGKIINAVNTY